MAETPKKTKEDLAKAKASREKEALPEVVEPRFKATVLEPKKDSFIKHMFVDVLGGVFGGIVRPAMATFLRDMLFETIEFLFRGPDDRRGSTGRYSHRDYSSYSRRANAYREPVEPRTFRDADELQTILFGSRGEAEEVLDYLDGTIREFGVATVADLYESVGIRHTYTDRDRGWTDVSKCRIIRSRRGDGFEIEMPRTRGYR